MAVVTIKHLLEAGVHFGHKTRKWNPKMKRFIYDSRDGIYILDLQKTLEQLQRACNYIRDRVIKGGSILFVGTKKQAREAVMKAGKDTGMHYVEERWLGGTLTNNVTIRKSIKRMKELDLLFENGTAAGLPKKEIASLGREREKLHKNLDGIKEMNRLPKVVFVVDPKREKIAVAEARKLNIPIVAMIDTNSDPDDVDFPVPSNDDAIKSVELITDIVSRIVKEAIQEREKLGIVVQDEEPDADKPVSADPRGDERSRRGQRRSGPRDRKREGGSRGPRQRGQSRRPQLAKESGSDTAKSEESQVASPVDSPDAPKVKAEPPQANPETQNVNPPVQE